MTTTSNSTAQITDIIRKKRDGEILSAAEIALFVRSVAAGDIAEAQIGAFLMACYFRPPTAEETSILAREMAHSGEMLDLSDIPGTVDKHSTGGVGDKTTLVVAPLAAAAGVPVLKLSGAALGHTGGTIDRLQAIAGFRTDLPFSRFVDQVKTIGLAVGGHTANLVPADKKLYATRDITATVEVVPLIAASVMSKKLAGGAAAIVLDVKCGGGAFMQTLEEARALAQAMVSIGQAAGRSTRALITAMDQPLGRAVGEAVETREAIETLQGGGPADFVDLCLLVAAHMIHLGEQAKTVEAARDLAQQLLNSGAALEKFRRMVQAQGGDTGLIDAPEALGQAAHSAEITAPQEGYITGIDARALGTIARRLVHSHRGGILLARKVGDRVKEGETLCRLLSDSPDTLQEAARRLPAAFTIGDAPPPAAPILLHPPIGSV